MIIYDLARIWLPGAEEWCADEGDRDADTEAYPDDPPVPMPSVVEERSA